MRVGDRDRDRCRDRDRGREMIEVYEDLVTVIRISKINSSHIIQATLSHRQFYVSLPVRFSVCLYLFFSLSFCFLCLSVSLCL